MARTYNKRGSSTSAELCEFNQIQMPVPRVRLVRLALKKDYLSQEEAGFIRAMLWRAEATLYKVQHVMSICERALRKT